MEDTSLDRLKIFLSEDLEGCIEQLLEITKMKHRKEFDEVIQLQARVLQLFKSQRLGLLTNDDINLELSKIRKSLLDIINIIESKQKLANVVTSFRSGVRRNLKLQINKRYIFGITILVGIIITIYFYYLNDQKYAINIASEFISASKIGDTTKMKEIFPPIEKYKKFPKMDFFNILNCERKGDRIIVRALKQFVLNEDVVVYFFFKKEGFNRLKMIDTKGLLFFTYPTSEYNDNIKLAIRLGCVETTDLNDIQVIGVSNKIDSLIAKNRSNFISEIEKSLTITNISNEINPSSGDAIIKGIMLNNLPFIIPEITLKFNFFDSENKLITVYNEKVSNIPANEGKPIDFLFARVGRTEYTKCVMIFDDKLLRTYLIHNNDLKNIKCSEIQ